MSTIKHLIKTYHEPFMRLFSSTDGLSVEEAVSEINAGTIQYLKRTVHSAFSLGTLAFSIGLLIAGMMNLYSDSSNTIWVTLLISGGFLLANSLSSMTVNARYAYVCRLHGMQRVLNNHLMAAYRSDSQDKEAFDKDLVEKTLIIVSKMAKVQDE